MNIDSRWVVEKGRWSKNADNFVDRTTEGFMRTIKMEIVEGEYGSVLRFVGGPTGYESYYISDLLKGKKNEGELCICGGTINRWPACFVDKQEVMNFIQA